MTGSENVLCSFQGRFWTGFWELWQGFGWKAMRRLLHNPRMNACARNGFAGLRSCRVSKIPHAGANALPSSAKLFLNIVQEQ